MAVGELEMRDLSHAGVELGGARVTGLPAELALGELLAERIRADVARYNTAPGEVFACLVQPADSVRHRDGHRMRRPRPLDAEPLVAAAREAVARGMLWFRVGGETVTDLDHRVDVDEHDEVLAILRRPVVAEVG